MAQVHVYMYICQTISFGIEGHLWFGIYTCTYVVCHHVTGPIHSCLYVQGNGLCVQEMVRTSVPNTIIHCYWHTCSCLNCNCNQLRRHVN